MIGLAADLERQDAWHRVLDRLRLEVDDDVFDWLRRLELRDVGLLERDVTVTVVAPTTFARAWVATYYGDRLFALWRAEDERIGEFTIVSPPLVRLREYDELEEIRTPEKFLDDPEALARCSSKIIDAANASRRGSLPTIALHMTVKWLIAWGYPGAPLQP